MEQRLLVRAVRYCLNSMLINVSQAYIYEKDKLRCPVPTRGGKLISLSSVYASWKKNGVVKDWTNEAFPPFQAPNYPGLMALADPNQVLLFHTLLTAAFTTNEPPFKIQFKKDGGEWCDVVFTDQIKIAAVIYRTKQGERQGKPTEHLIVQNNELFFSVSFVQGVFKFDIKEFIGETMKHIPSRLIVIDATFEII